MTVADLEAYGLERMDDAAIEAFLDGQSTGVLGLPTDGAPYLLPLSYGFDGEDRLYFTLVLGDSSRKRTLTDRTDRASFLVYSAETMFNWRSVLTHGPITAVPQQRWSDLDAVLEDVWRPELFQAAGAGVDVAIYELDVESWTGIRHTGLAPAYENE